MISETNIMKGAMKILRNERNRCQSCGMPLFYDKKPKVHPHYCSYCHDGSSFRDDKATLRDMQKKVDKLLVARNANRGQRLYMRLRLATLKRWRESRAYVPKTF